MIGGIGAIARLELGRLVRARTSFTLLLLVPALQVMLFGYAIRPQGGPLSVAIAAPSPQNAAAVVARLAREPRLRVTIPHLPVGGAEAAVRQGRVSIGIEVPVTRSFSDPFVPLHPVRIVVDAANAALTDEAVAHLAAGYWHDVAARNVDAPSPGLRIERLYNPAGRSDWTFLPGLIGVTVMISMVMLGCLSVAREREASTWETLLSLPVGRGAVMAGKTLPYAALGTLQGLLVLTAGVFLFDLPTRGPVIGLIMLLPVFAAAHFLIGYAVSARAATQIDALQGAVAFYLPAMLLSGFLYPFDTLPDWAQAIGRFFPLTHFIGAARDVLLRGRGWAELGAAAIPIVACLGVAAAAAWLLQTRRLD